MLNRFLRHGATAAAYAVAMTAALAQPVPEIELPNGLRPDSDRTIQVVSEVTQRLTVVKDNGLLEQARSRGLSFPLSLSTVTRRTMRQVSGARAADGSFPGEIHLISDEMAMRTPDGSERPVPNRPSLTGMTVALTVDRDGRIEKESLRLIGAAEGEAKVVQSIFASLVEQLAGSAGVRLSAEKVATQERRITLTAPGADPLEFTILTIYKLRSVEDGKALIETQASLGVGQGTSNAAISATGFGSGTMTYDIAAQRIDRTAMRMLMSIEARGRDGVLAIESSGSDTIVTSETLSPAPRSDGAAAAQVSGTILEEGVFDSAVVGHNIAPGAAAGRTAVIDGVALKDAGRRLPAKQGVSFGFKYQLAGVPGGTLLQLELRVRHPPMTAPDGKTSTITRAPLYVRSDDGTYMDFMIYRLSEPFELPAGKLIFEIYDGERPTLSREFLLEAVQ